MEKSSIEEARSKINFSLAPAKKKSPYQRHMEEVEERKRKEEEAAAAIYEDFVESFQKNDKVGGKAFVRAGVQMGEKTTEEKSGGLYKPKPMFGGGEEKKKREPSPEMPFPLHPVCFCSLFFSFFDLCFFFCFLPTNLGEKRQQEKETIP